MINHPRFRHVLRTLHVRSRSECRSCWCFVNGKTDCAYCNSVDPYWSVRKAEDDEATISLISLSSMNKHMAFHKAYNLTTLSFPKT